MQRVVTIGGLGRIGDLDDGTDDDTDDTDDTSSDDGTSDDDTDDTSSDDGTSDDDTDDTSSDDDSSPDAGGGSVGTSAPASSTTPGGVPITSLSLALAAGASFVVGWILSALVQKKRARR